MVGKLFLFLLVSLSVLIVSNSLYFFGHRVIKIFLTVYCLNSRRDFRYIWIGDFYSLERPFVFILYFVKSIKLFKYSIYSSRKRSSSSFVLYLSFKLFLCLFACEFYPYSFMRYYYVIRNHFMVLIRKRKNYTKLNSLNECLFILNII